MNLRKNLKITVGKYLKFLSSISLSHLLLVFLTNSNNFIKFGVFIDIQSLKTLEKVNYIIKNKVKDFLILGIS